MNWPPCAASTPPSTNPPASGPPPPPIWAEAGEAPQAKRLTTARASPALQTRDVMRIGRFLRQTRCGGTPRDGLGCRYGGRCADFTRRPRGLTREFLRGWVEAGASVEGLTVAIPTYNGARHLAEALR